MTDQKLFFTDILDQIEIGDARDFSVNKRRRKTIINDPVSNTDTSKVELRFPTEPHKLILNLLENKEKIGGEF